MRTPAKRSFTLVEVIVAVAILLIAIMGTIGAMAVSSNLRLSTKQNELATQALQEVLETYRGKDRPAIATDAAAEIAGAQLYTGTEEKALGVGATRNVYLLSERECKILLPADLDYSGAIDDPNIAAELLRDDDAYDLDGDGTKNELHADSDRTTYHSSTGRVIPILIRIQWGRQRPIGNKPILTAVHDAVPTATQVVGAVNVTREFYIEVVSFIYPTSTS